MILAICENSQKQKKQQSQVNDLFIVNIASSMLLRQNTRVHTHLSSSRNRFACWCIVGSNGNPKI